MNELLQDREMFCKRAAEITNFLAAAAAKLFDLDQSRAGLGCGRGEAA
jgi:hypothetical protein